MFRVFISGPDVVGVEVDHVPAEAVVRVRRGLEHPEFEGVEVVEFEGWDEGIALDSASAELVCSAADALRRDGVLVPTFAARAIDLSERPAPPTEEPPLHGPVRPMEGGGLIDDTYVFMLSADTNPAWSGTSARDLARVVVRALREIDEKGEAVAHSGLVWVNLGSPEAADRLAVELGLPGYSDPRGMIGRPSEVRAAAVRVQAGQPSEGSAGDGDTDDEPSGFFVYVQASELVVPAGGVDDPPNGYDAADALGAELHRAGLAGVELDPEADGFSISASDPGTVTAAVDHAKRAGIIATSYSERPANYLDSYERFGVSPTPAVPVVGKDGDEPRRAVAGCREPDGGRRHQENAVLLQGKTAIVYGTGRLGAGVARTLATEGARVFVAGRTARTVLGVVAGITADGGTAEGTVLDVLDEEAVAEHLDGVVAQTGRVDVSINLTSREDKQGTPLIDMRTEDVTRGPHTALTGQFVTARAAARQMVEQGSGVILAVTSGTARSPSAGMGNTASADAAVEGLLRTLAAELGPRGVRVLNVYTAAVAETLTRERIAAVSGQDVDPEVVLDSVAAMTTLRRAPALADVAGTIAFLCSDRAGSMTGTTINVTCGMVPG